MTREEFIDKWARELHGAILRGYVLRPYDPAKFVKAMNDDADLGKDIIGKIYDELTLKPIVQSQIKPLPNGLPKPVAATPVKDAKK